MKDPTPNLPLLRKVVEYIDNQPLGWDQAQWLIDVEVKIESLKLNIAAINSPMSSFTKDYKKVIERMLAKYQETLAADCGTVGCIAGWTVQMSYDKEEFVVNADGSMNFFDGDDIEVVAQELLGLTGVESQRLFYGGNNREDVQEICEEIAARAGEKF